MKIHEKLLELRNKEKAITGQIIDALQVMEDSKEYLKLGYSSLFDYLVRGLKYSESTAYQRQSCLRLSREIPEIKQKVDEGALSFSTVTMVYKATRRKSLEKKKQIINSIENKSARDVKKMFLEPLKEIKVKETHYQDKVVLKVELSHKSNEKLQRLKALKSHTKSLDELFKDFIDKELKAYESTGFRATKSKNNRYISRRLRNMVLKSANYKCEYPGCEETHFLQIDHILPVRLGGRGEAQNLQALCGAHNRMKG